MGVQVVPEADEHKFEFDLLDATKIIPEEEIPVRMLGRLVLDRNPDNYFAETEQVAFHPGHIVSGVEFSNDPLLQGRLFSYLDTQLKRVGPNFAQIPINRPTCPFSNNQRDAESQQHIHKGRVAYFPNSLANGCPAHSPEGMQAFSTYREKVDGHKVRERSPSFADHFSQATLFWNSMADWEKKHIAEAISFELNQCEVDTVRSRVLNELFVNVADDLAEMISKNTGIPITAKRHSKPHNKTSSALSMNKLAPNLKGRRVAIIVADGVDGAQVSRVVTFLKTEGAVGEIVAKTPGIVKGADGRELKVDRPAPNAPSVLYDAVVIPGGPSAEIVAKQALVVQFVREAFSHYKPIAAIGDGVVLLDAAKLDKFAPGMITVSEEDFIDALKIAMLKHRHFEREVETI